MKLPKGVRIDHSYVQVRIQHGGITYCKNFGKDSEIARELACIHLAEKRKEILLNKFGINKEVPRKRFSDVAKIYLVLWTTEQDPDGNPKHTPIAIRNQKWRIERSLIPFFGKMWYDDIKPVDVLKWRENRVSTVLGTTADKEQIALSSLYTHIQDWIAIEKIEAFKTPAENFCRGVKKAAVRKRTRLLTTQELSLLRKACEQIGDNSLWKIITLALRSLLRTKDLMGLEAGTINTIQAKTGNAIQLPVNADVLNYTNLRKRWELVRKMAQIEDVQFRDLRKTGANLLKMCNHSNVLISQFLGHSNTRTTELYMVQNQDHLKPLADTLDTIVNSL